MFESKKHGNGTSRPRTRKPGTVATYDSMGVGIRVIAGGCWGFAATDEISPKGLERAANLAIEIARSGTLAKKRDVVLAPKKLRVRLDVSLPNRPLQRPGRRESRTS